MYYRYELYQGYQIVAGVNDEEQVSSLQPGYACFRVRRGSEQVKFYTKRGHCLTEKCTKRDTLEKVIENWVNRTIKLVQSDLKTFKSVLETWRPPLPEETHFYSHEPDGRFTTLEMLRRATFNEWYFSESRVPRHHYM